MNAPSLYDYFDLAQVTLYLFWIFFAGLIFYLQREGQREGYPVETEGTPGKFRSKSLLFFPPPKTYTLPHGGSAIAPNDKADTRPVPGVPAAKFGGAPLVPNGKNPMLDSIGPGSWAERADTPDLTIDGRPKIVPLRAAPTYATSSKDPAIMGWNVMGCDYEIGGKVVDFWVDRSECLIRYIEVEVPLKKGSRRVLLPMTFARISMNPKGVEVEAILASQFADVPGTANPESVTLLEEDKICAYYGSGTLYAVPRRQESLL
jgi:photosynthetic reaction center H subunit